MTKHRFRLQQTRRFDIPTPAGAGREKLMRLSTKSRYAVTAMLDLALNGKQGPVTLADISENQNISLSYLEQLFASLRAKQLVRGVRGPGGGYFLARPAEDISIAQIVCAVDEWVEYIRSPEYLEKNSDQPQCTTRALWDDLSGQLFNFLADVKLSALVERGELALDAVASKRAAGRMQSLAERAA